MSQKVCKRLGLISRVRKCLTMKASKCVYNVIVQPLFDYIDSAWGDLSEGCSQELQRLQNRAAHIILQCGSSQNTFRLMKWINLASRRKMHKCIQVFKCQNNFVPGYLRDYFVKNSSFHSYNTRRKHDLHLPNLKHNL